MLEQYYLDATATFLVQNGQDAHRAMTQRHYFALAAQAYLLDLAQSRRVSRLHIELQLMFASLMVRVCGFDLCYANDYCAERKQLVLITYVKIK
jgi:hypothetical protein